jgi:hypothetical protein
MQKVIIKKKDDPIFRIPDLQSIFDGPVDVVVLERNAGDDLSIIYIANPLYDPKVKNDIYRSAPYIALTKGDYQFV